jgi:hypothetical protein
MLLSLPVPYKEIHSPSCPTVEVVSSANVEVSSPVLVIVRVTSSTA